MAIRVPRPLQDRQLRVAKVRDALTTKLGHAPSVPEIAAAIDAPVEDVVAAVLSTNARRGRSLDEPIGEDLTLADSLGAVDPGIECAEMRALLDSALDVLCARDQELLRLRYEDDLSQTEIGQRVGVSQMQVSRLIGRSVALMRRRIERPLELRPTLAAYRTPANPLAAPVSTYKLAA